MWEVNTQTSNRCCVHHRVPVPLPERDPLVDLLSQRLRSSWCWSFFSHQLLGGIEWQWCLHCWFAVVEATLWLLRQLIHGAASVSI